MQIISHPPSKGFEAKPLDVHLTNVAESCKGIIMGLDLNLCLISKDSLAQLAYMMGLLHDIGKATTFFQKKLTGGDSSGPMSNHSLVSAVVAIQNIGNYNYPAFALPLAFKAIQRHHGNMDSISELEDMESSVLFQTVDIYNNLASNAMSSSEFRKFIENNRISLQPLSKYELKQLLKSLSETDLNQESIEDSFEMFIIQSLLFSVLVASDKTDAARLDMHIFEQAQNDLNLSPKKYIEKHITANNNSPIQSVRQLFLSEVGSSVKIESNQYLYTLTAPTGSGKTLACMNFITSLQAKITKPRKVIYCLPYTSIIDQNYTIYKDLIIGNHGVREESLFPYIIRHHHLQDNSGLTKKAETYEFWDYMNDMLIVETWSSAMIVSTFVQLFHTLVGHRNSMLKKFHNIINSIIILDEIQNIDPQFYCLLRILFRVLAERFHTYILLCTATQPYLLDEKECVELSPAGIFANDIFNRIKLVFEPDAKSVDDLVSSFGRLKTNNMLLILNTRKAAKKAYQYLKDILVNDYKVFCLTTDQIPIHRTEIINHVQRLLEAKARVVLVATQLLEAGVDISFEYVVRDFAPFDSIVQSAGRCNRHGELGTNGGFVRLVNLIDDSGESYSHKVYDKYLLQQTKAVLSKKCEYSSIDLAYLTSQYYQTLDCKAQSMLVIDSIKHLNYDDNDRGKLPISDFRLIRDDYESQVLYLLCDKEKTDLFNEFIYARDAVKRVVDNQELRDSLWLKLIKCHNQIKGFSLCLKRFDLQKHIRDNRHMVALKDSDYEYYIDAENYLSCYSDETGFSQQVNDLYNQWSL